MPSREPIRIGSRGSALARIQAETLRESLAAQGFESVIEIITTDGDRRAPDTAWGEGAFVTAIEDALLRGDIDVAVHSAKDVPTDEDPRLTIGAFLARGPAGDVIVIRAGATAPDSIDDVPHGARVGTDSPRRTAFLLAVRPDLAFHPLHGNVDTRLRRLDAGETDALVLAEAGLARLGRADRVAIRLDPELLPPAPGQGALAVQVRTADAEIRPLIARLDDPATRRAVGAERALLAGTGGGCRAPVGALAEITADGRLELTGGYARPDGSVRVIVKHLGAAKTQSHEPEADERLVRAVLDDLSRQAAAAAMTANAPRVLTTRAIEQAPPLMLALVDRGLAPLSVPAIEIAPGDHEHLVDVVRRLTAFAWVVVTSANAVTALRDAARDAGLALGTSPAAGPQWAAVGTATRRALTAAGVTVALQPERASGSALADALPLLGGERVLLPRSDIADGALVDRLTARAADVETVVAYRTIEAPGGSTPMLQSALTMDPIATILTSGSTARGLLALAARLEARDRILSLPTICIGPETAREARRLGYRVGAEAPMQGPGGIADSVIECILSATPFGPVGIPMTRTAAGEDRA